MMRPVIKEVVFKHPKIKYVFGDSFIYEPTNVEEEKLGSLYILGEITNVSRSSSADLINQLALIIKKEFYSNPKKPSETALEAALKKANALIKDFDKKQKSEADRAALKNLNFFAAVFNNGTLYFSKIGKIQTALFRYQEIIQDIDQTLEHEFTKGRLPSFSGIIKGELEIGDKLIFANRDLFKLLSLGQLKNIFKTAADEKLPFLIESKVKENKEPFSVFAVFLEIMGESINGGSYQSFHPEKIDPLTLEEIIGPEYIARTNQMFNAQTKSEKLFLPQESDFPRENKFAKKGLERWRSVSFLKLPLISQLLMIFFIGFALFVVGGIYISVQKNQTAQTKDFYGNIIQQAKDKRDQAQNALIYQDSPEAKTKLEEALKLLQETDFAYFKEEAEKLESEIQKNLEKVQGLVELKNIKLIFDFKDLGLTFRPSKIFGQNKNLIFLDSFSNDIYKYNLDNPASSGLIITPADESERLLLGDWTKDILVFYSSKNKIYFYNALNNNFTSYPVKPSKENGRINDLGFYKGVVYLLDGINKEIIKYSPELSDAGSSLFNQEKAAALTSPVSLSLTGSAAYILQSDGQIKKYNLSRGSFENVALPSPVQLKNPVKIRLGFTTSNIYILDQEGKRVVILNKKGEIKQYFSEEFSKPVDFWMTDDEKTIYLLDGQKVYQIDNK